MHCRDAAQASRNDGEAGEEMNIRKLGGIALLIGVNWAVFLSAWNDWAKGIRATAVVWVCLMVLFIFFRWGVSVSRRPGPFSA
jgi:hypothetical protein